MLVHSGSGPSEEVHSWGPDLARQGFLAVAGCFFRTPMSVSPRNTPLSLCPDAPEREDTLAVRNLAALIEAARRQPGAQRDRVGLVGWSWGGALALVAAASMGTDVKAVVAVAGGPLGLQLSRNDPSAQSVVDRLTVPVLILHGVNDSIVPVGFVQEFEARARELGKNVEGHYIEGADHFLWSDPRFRGELFNRSVAFLQRHLGR